MDNETRIELADTSIFDEDDVIDVVALFSYGVNQGCSDIHMLPGAPPKIRVNGELRPVEGARTLTFADTNDIREQTMSPEDLGIFMRKVYEHYYSYRIPGIGQFRIVITRALGGVVLVARKLVETPPSFDSLGTLPVIRDLANLHSGLVLFSGITGSGKSTLMSAIVNEINRTRGVNIISIEGPVEIIHKSLKGNVIQRNVGSDVETYAEGVRDAMKQDPDVLIIGETVDTATAAACLSAAETGHLVFSTVHALSTTASITRMLDLFPHAEQKSVRNRLAEVLKGIVTQKLVRSTDPSGSLVAVNEVLLNTADFQQAIEQEATNSELHELLKASRDSGMQTMEDHFAELVRDGIVSPKVALAQAINQEEMKQQLNDLNITETVTADTVNEIEQTEVPFSQRIALQEEATGKVMKNSGAALVLPDSPQPPKRPQVYIPRKR